MWEGEGHFQGSKLCTAALSPCPAPGYAAVYLLFPRARPKPPDTKLVLVVLVDLSEHPYNPVVWHCMEEWYVRRTAHRPVRPMGSGFPSSCALCSRALTPSWRCKSLKETDVSHYVQSLQYFNAEILRKPFKSVGMQSLESNQPFSIIYSKCKNSILEIYIKCS